jgi:hypothetical protein
MTGVPPTHLAFERRGTVRKMGLVCLVLLSVGLIPAPSEAIFVSLSETGFTSQTFSSSGGAPVSLAGVVIGDFMLATCLGCAGGARVFIDSSGGVNTIALSDVTITASNSATLNIHFSSNEFALPTATGTYPGQIALSGFYNDGTSASQSAKTVLSGSGSPPAPSVSAPGSATLAGGFFGFQETMVPFNCGDGCTALFGDLAVTLAAGESVTLPGSADVKMSQILRVPVPAPVPEPSTLLLLGSGLSGLIMWGSRKRFENRRRDDMG